MVRPETLLLYAREFLEIEVSEEAVEDAERVGSLLAGDKLAGWTAHALSVALEVLDSEAPVQAAAIRAALATGGFVTRDAVYEFGGYGEDRTLRGFTRPARRISRELREQGLISSTADELLEAVYDPGFSYVQASGFRVPRELLAVIRQQGDDGDAAAALPSPMVAMTSGASIATLTFTDDDGSVHTAPVPRRLAERLIAAREYQKREDQLSEMD